MRKRVLAGMLFVLVIMAAGCGAKEEYTDQIDQTETVTESVNLEQIETKTEEGLEGQLGG